LCLINSGGEMPGTEVYLSPCTKLLISKNALQLRYTWEPLQTQNSLFNETMNFLCPLYL
jgi:hypothetical protein